MSSSLMPGSTPGSGGTGSKPGATVSSEAKKYENAPINNKYDFMQFSTTPSSIVGHLSFLMSYLTSLYLLDFVSNPA